MGLFILNIIGFVFTIVFGSQYLKQKNYSMFGLMAVLGLINLFFVLTDVFKIFIFKS